MRESHLLLLPWLNQCTSGLIGSDLLGIFFAGCKEPPQCIPDDGSCKCPEEVFDMNGCLVAKSKDNVPEGLECGELMSRCFMGKFSSSEEQVHIIALKDRKMSHHVQIA